MKNLNIVICFFIITSIFGGCKKAIINADYEVIPLPQKITLEQGEGFILNRNTRIVYLNNNEKQRQIAEFLGQYINSTTGLELSITSEELTENAIILRTDYESDKNESYKLTVDNKLIVINGKDDAGTFYGVQTLRKAIPASCLHNIVVFPIGTIENYPRFEYRGSMLDVARHMFPKEFIKKYIDILALHNINHFHLHLTDDQGWRIEIKKYPELTEIGSKRAQTVIGKNTGKYDGKPYGGFYTQDEIKEIIEYADKRFITIIPEIDLPGHMLGALATYPNLGCTGGPYKVAEEWGIFDDVLCAGNEETYTFLEGVFNEIVNLFPSKYIHIGGDECPKTRWEECPTCQAKIKELGLTSDAHHSKESKLQNYVMGRIEKYLNDKDRQIIGWDEILEGGTGSNATIMSWRGTDGGIVGAKANHDVIMAPYTHLYFDYYQTKDVDNEPFAIGGHNPIERVYNFEPVPDKLNENEKKYIKGVQANLWVEYIKEPEHVEYMLLPRLAALSEIQWTLPEKKDLKHFFSRLSKLLDIYKSQGYNYAKHVTNITAEVKPDLKKGITTISMITFDNAPIYYTLDGNEPTVKSLKYEESIEISSSTDLRAVVIRGEERSKEYTNSFSFNKATLKEVTLENQPDNNYIYNGIPSLVNGKRGSSIYSDSEWVGFYDSDFIATVDLREPTNISTVTIGLYRGGNSWIFGATEYIVSISADGKNFKHVSEQKYSVWDNDTQVGETVDIIAKFPQEKARYVKIIAKKTPVIPDWHPGKGNKAYLFVDEIIIE